MQTDLATGRFLLMELLRRMFMKPARARTRDAIADAPPQNAMHLYYIPHIERNRPALCIQPTPKNTLARLVSSRRKMICVAERSPHMDVRTRVKLAKFSEKIKKYPEMAQSMGAMSNLLPKPVKDGDPEISLQR